MDFEAKFNVLETVENDGTKPLVAMFARGKAAKRFHDPSTFNGFIKEYLQAKISDPSPTTDTWNQWQVVKAMNAIYLDGDYTVEGDIPEGLNEKLALLIFQEFYMQVGSKTPCIDFFIFIPTTGGNKGGFHTMIFTDKVLTKDDLDMMYVEVMNKILSNPSHPVRNEMVCAGISCENVEDFHKFLDKGCFDRRMMLLPFAQKSADSRQYKCISHDFGNVENFILPCTHQNVDTVEFVDDAEIYDLGDEEEGDVESTTDTTLFSPVAKMTVEFIESLRYMSPKSKFWTYLSVHDNRWAFEKMLFDWLFNTEIMALTHHATVLKLCDTIIAVMVKIVQPLYALTVNPAIQETTERHLTKSIAQRISETARNFMSWSRTCKILNEKDDYTFPLIESIGIAIRSGKKWRSKFAALPAIAKFLANTQRGDNAVAKAELMGRMSTIVAGLENSTLAFSRFMTKLEGFFTDEIRCFPFRQVVHYGEDIRAEFDPKHDDKAEYDKVIRLWLKVFTMFSYFNSPKSMIDAYRSAINVLVKRFVYEDTSGTYPMTYIYNIRQFPKMNAYPYNQWIRDDYMSLLMEWFSTLYERYLSSAFRTENVSGFIIDLHHILSMNSVFNDAPFPLITPVTDFDTEIKKLMKNVVCISKCSDNVPRPILIPVTDNSPFFPMRNGILEFIVDDGEDVRDDGLKRGDVIFHGENYDRVMNAYTNIMWNEHYNKNCEAYRRVERMFEETLPDKSIRDYVLSMYAQTLHSVGQRDQVHQHYGTGAEGKSLLNHAVQVMLGMVVGGSQSVKNGDNEIYSNPRGLAQTLKAEALIQANNNCHDSGGIADLIDCRFVSVQEPVLVSKNGSVKIDTATIKSLTGGSYTKARRIYKEAENFRPKLFITIQTNKRLGYNEVSDAIIRRAKTIDFTEKFFTDSVKTKPIIPASDEDLTHIRHADRELPEYIDSDVTYWEALFQLLLPFAQDFIRSGRSAISDIPCPEAVHRMSQQTLNQSNGVMMWLSKNVVTDYRSCISVYDIAAKIDATYRRGSSMGGNSGDYDREMMSLNQMDRMDMIYSALMSRFAAHHLYKLKDKFWENRDGIFEKWLSTRINHNVDLFDDDNPDYALIYPPTHSKFDKDNPMTDEDSEDMKEWQRYFDSIPVNNIYTLDEKYTKGPCGYDWLQMIYIVGFRMKDMSA